MDATAAPEGTMRAKHLLRSLPLLALTLLAGCQKMVLLHPSGYVAQQQSHILVITTIILATIIGPVLIAVAVVAWRYRASNRQTTFAPDWDRSPKLELLVWAWPLLIIIILGAISWIGTHQLDPYRPLDRVAPDMPVTSATDPLQVDVVSLRWRWLFFYPQYGIATVNQLAAPVNVPINFRLTSDIMMDGFFIPALAGQIYTMPGMQTQLHAAINKVGSYAGFSANYSGSGFTDMRFRFLGMTQADFHQWVAQVRAAGGDLDATAYETLAQPTRNPPVPRAPVQYFAHYTPGLYTRVLNRCVLPGQVCISQMKATDMADMRAALPAPRPAPPPPER
jgi:cytochrome o ubiquinol oxidase subunit 2